VIQATAGTGKNGEELGHGRPSARPSSTLRRQRPHDSGHASRLDRSVSVSMDVTKEHTRAMSLTADDLDDIVDRAVAGNAAAISELLGRIHPMVVRYCRARLSGGHRSLSTADDIAQEVCMAVLTALPSYRREGRPFIAFVYGIAGNKVVDAHRAAGRSKSNPMADVPDMVAGDPTPEDLVVGASVASRMHELLKVLPATQREILIMRVGTGLSAEETAEALGTTPGAVRVAQHRALAKLRSLVASDTGLAEQLL
jgi:RNA polymerase sigma-70 factor (ECF subfamily)